MALATAFAAGCYCAPALSFTAEQAAVGRAAFEQTCATCHGANLRQLPNALLAGPEFVARWSNRGTNELISQTRSTMPPSDPGGLGADVYTNIVAYLLQANGAPPSEAAITAASTERLGKDLPGEAVVLTAPESREPTGVIVAGTVPDFVPVTDDTLRHPSPADWIMLRHDYSATSLRRRMPRTCGSRGFGRCVTAESISLRRSFTEALSTLRTRVASCKR